MAPRPLAFSRTAQGRAMIKASDYIARFLADRGVRHVFMITGGGAMHLNDSLGKEGRLQYVCNHHEQALRNRRRRLCAGLVKPSASCASPPVRAARTPSPACWDNGWIRSPRSTFPDKSARKRPWRIPACPCGNWAIRRPTLRRSCAPSQNMPCPSSIPAKSAFTWKRRCILPPRDVPVRFGWTFPWTSSRR